MKRQKRYSVSVLKNYPEYGFNKWAIPMYVLPQGTYTVDLLHGNGNHYPFTLIRLKRLETPLMSSREVIGYRAEYTAGGAVEAARTSLISKGVTFVDYGTV